MFRFVFLLSMYHTPECRNGERQRVADAADAKICTKQKQFAKHKQRGWCLNVFSWRPSRKALQRQSSGRRKRLQLPFSNATVLFSRPHDYCDDSWMISP